MFCKNVCKLFETTKTSYKYGNFVTKGEACEFCKLLNLPEWDIGPEDAMQIDLLPNLPPSGGYENVLTAIDVFSRYLFAYPLTDASAINVAKVLNDIMTQHASLRTTLITDKGTAFTSTIIAEVTQILGNTPKCATTKHLQTIGKLERSHASLKTDLKMACGEYRRQWHKYLPLAVLNHNTSYHTNLGCEPTRVFHGRVPYNFLDQKLGNNPNEQITPKTKLAEEIQNRTKMTNDVNDAAQNQNERMKMTSAKEMKLAKLIKMRTLIDRIRPFTRKMSEKQENDANFYKEIQLMKTMHKIVQRRRMILSCPKYRKMNIEMKV